MNRAGVVMVAVLGVCCLASPPASGNERVGVVSTEVEGVLIDRAGWVKEWDLELTSVLTRARMTIEALPEGKCGSDSKCLKLLAGEKHLDLIVGAHVLNDEGLPPTYHVKVWVYSARHGDEPPRALEKACARCSEGGVTSLLSALLSEALEPPKLPGLQPTGLAWRPRPWLVAVQVGLGVAGAALVGVGAKVLYDDGRQNCSMTGPIRQCPAIGDTTSQGAPLAAIGAVLFAGAVVSVALEYTLPNRRLKLTPLGDKSTAGAAISGVW